MKSKRKNIFSIFWTHTSGDEILDGDAVSLPYSVRPVFRLHEANIQLNIHEDSKLLSRKFYYFVSISSLAFFTILWRSLIEVPTIIVPSEAN